MGPNHKSKGLKGRLADHTLTLFRPRLGGYIHMSVHKSILCSRVGGNWEKWPADHIVLVCSLTPVNITSV
jgi:hypothetical protein